MDEYLIDLRGVTDRASLHCCLREALPLPEWYGGNLDALYDSLTEMPVPMTIRLRNWTDLQDSMPACFDGFQRVLLDARADLPGLTVLFEGSGTESPAEDVLEEIYEAQKDMGTDAEPE